MRSTSTWIWLAALAASAAAIAMTAPSAYAARRRAGLALERHDTLMTQAAQLESLRQQTPEWASRSRDDAALTTRISASLAGCGLSADVLASVAGDSESAQTIAGARFVRRRASAVLTKLTLPSLGRFLADWRTQAPEWTVTSIEITSDSSRPPSPGTDLMLRVALVFESIHAEQSLPASERGG